MEPKSGSIFTPIPHGKILWEILDQFKEKIASGELSKGDRLPSERQMSEGFGVSRTTIREALKSLEMLGLVECVQGDGNFIAQNLDHSLTEPLSIMFMLEGGSLVQVQQLRRAMELTTVGLAARKAGPAQLGELEEICQQLEEPLPETSRVELDLQFHYGIAQTAGNPLILATLHAVETLIDTQIRGVREEMLKAPYNLEQINRQHRAILEALKNGEERAAAEAMEAHMDFIEEYLLAK